MDIKIFKEKLFKKALENGFTDCEIYYYSGKSQKISILNGEIEKFDNATSGGLSFRGFYNNKVGYSYTEQLSESIIDKLIQYAKENSEIINDEEKEEIYIGDKQYTPVKTFYEEIENIDLDTLIEKALAIEKATLNYDNRIISCNHCIVGKSFSHVYISNTKGLELNKKENYIMAYAGALAKENNIIKSGIDIICAFNINDINPTLIGENAAKKAISYLDATSLPSKNYNIIFENECFSDLLSCFLGNFYAENVQKGFSLLKNKLNQKIANDKITILDEPLMENGYSSSSFDSEGVACYNKTIVENGVLKTYLYNLKTAKKDGVKSTGNGFKNGYKGKVSISTTNFYIKNGDKPLDTLLEDLKDGIYITEISGLHAGVNSISGDFSILSNGYLIENGKKVKSVEQITVAGNFYDMLLNIKDIANDLKFTLNGVGSPSIFVGTLSVSGE
ncbi:TldD/PmbA family protein [[Clostridium] colinum]|uniref:TldD/PmbA family protein n=1 Tax=[Clostridium] colinum TaxID=36835 RepID=UPI002025195D|nr:TldD/PmbA family protein [[Clostridium] colinum]